MLRLEAFAPTDLVDEVRTALVTMPGVRHVATGAATAEGLIALTAEVDTASADAAVDRLAEFGIASDDLTLWRVPGIQPLGWKRRTRSSDSDVQV